MKIITTFCASLLLATTTLFANAETPADLIMVATGPSELVVKIDEPLQANTQLSIRDEFGSILYEDEYAAHQRVGKLFNLQDFTSGNYQLVLTDGIFEDTYPFTVTDEGIEIKTAERKRSYLPIIKVTDEVATLSFMNNDLKDVEVSIVDANGKAVFFEEIKDEQLVSRRYNLSKIRRSNYEIVVVVGQKRITQSLAR